MLSLVLHLHRVSLVNKALWLLPGYLPLMEKRNWFGTIFNWFLSLYKILLLRTIYADICRASLFFSTLNSSHDQSTILHYGAISNNESETEAPGLVDWKSLWMAVGSSHREWIIRPLPKALKPFFSNSLEEKPPYLGHNYSYPIRIAKSDIVFMHWCLVISFKCAVLTPRMELTFCFPAHIPQLCVCLCVLSQLQPLLIKSDLIFYHWEEVCSLNNQVWQAIMMTA